VHSEDLHSGSCHDLCLTVHCPTWPALYNYPCYHSRYAREVSRPRAGTACKLFRHGSKGYLRRADAKGRQSFMSPRHRRAIIADRKCCVECCWGSSQLSSWRGRWSWGKIQVCSIVYPVPGLSYQLFSGSWPPSAGGFGGLGRGKRGGGAP